MTDQLPLEQPSETTKRPQKGKKNGRPPMTEEQRELMKQIKEDWHVNYNQSGENSPVWKGDKVGYDGIHSWVRRNKGKPNKCSFCKSIEKIEWANKSHKYKRDLDDWISLCHKCHFQYDKNYRLGGFYG